MLFGFEMKAYIGAALLTGVPSTGSWTEINSLKDVQVPDSYGEADVTTRANGGWKATAPTLRDAPVEFTIEWDRDNEEFGELLAAYRARLPIALAFLDGANTDGDSDGVAGNFSILKFARTEGLEDHVVAAVSVKPFSYVNDWKAT